VVVVVVIDEQANVFDPVYYDHSIPKNCLILVATFSSADALVMTQE